MLYGVDEINEAKNVFENQLLHGERFIISMCPSVIFLLALQLSSKGQSHKIEIGSWWFV